MWSTRAGPVRRAVAARCQGEVDPRIRRRRFDDNRGAGDDAGRPSAVKCLARDALEDLRLEASVEFERPRPERSRREVRDFVDAGGFDRPCDTAPRPPRCAYTRPQKPTPRQSGPAVGDHPGDAGRRRSSAKSRPAVVAVLGRWHRLVAGQQCITSRRTGNIREHLVHEGGCGCTSTRCKFWRQRRNGVCPRGSRNWAVPNAA